MDIIYQDGLERLAFELLKNGEKIMERVENLLGIKLEDRLKVYIVKNGDIANAYANPLDNVIVIYPNDLQPKNFIPSYKKWINYVFSHEYTHILLGRNYEKWLDVFRIFGDAIPPLIHGQHIPMYFHEGLAIKVETKLNKGRLEDPIFKMIIDDIKKLGIDLRYGGLTYVHIPGGNPYVIGSSFLSFVENEFGWGAIKEIVYNMKKPFTKFSNAVEEACKEDFRNLIKRWLKTFNTMHFNEFVKVEGNIRKPIFDSGKVYFMLENDFGKSGVYVFDGKKVQPVLLESSIVDFSVKDNKIVFIKRINTLEGYVNHVFIMGENMIGKNFVSVDWSGNDVVGIKQLENGLRDVVVISDNKEKTLLKGNEFFVPIQVTSDGSNIVLLAKFKGNIDLFLLKNERIYNLTNDELVEAFPLLREGILTFSKEIDGELHIFTMNFLNQNIEEFGKGIEATVYKKVILKTLFKNGRYRLFLDEKSRYVGKITPREVVVQNYSNYEYFSKIMKTHIPILPRFSLPIPGWFSTAFWDDLLKNIFIVGSFITDTDKGLYFIYQRFQNVPASFFALKTNNDFLFSGSVHFPTRLNTKQAWFSIGTLFDNKLSIFTSLSLGKVGGRRHYTSFPEIKISFSSEPSVSIGKGFLIGKSLNFLKVNLSRNPYLEFFNITPFLNIGWGFTDGWLVLDALDIIFSAKLGMKDTYVEGGVRLNTLVSYNFNIPLNFKISVGRKGMYFKVDLGSLDFPSFCTMFSSIK